MADSLPWSYVDDDDGLARVAQSLCRSRVFAVDTESDSLHSYFEKVCLLQLATPRQAFIVDPLKLEGRLSPLAEAFSNERIRKVLHGADYDIVCLKRDFGFEFANVFDTMVAAQHLGLERIGLADLVKEHFDESLDKRHARTNWARRPLPPDALEYSYLDVKFLIPLGQLMEDKLEEAGVLEEAGIEFRRLAARAPAAKSFDPDGYRRIRNSRDLSDRELAILRELFLMRDRQSRNLDIPPFKVLSNETMLRISTARPKNQDELSSVKGVTPFVRRRHGARILKAVDRGISRGKPPPRRARNPRGERLSPRRQRQMEKLKEWRKDRAAELELPTLVVLPNHAIVEIVKAGPRDVASLARLETVGEKRARLHGEDILRVLRR